MKHLFISEDGINFYDEQECEAHEEEYFTQKIKENKENFVVLDKNFEEINLLPISSVREEANKIAYQIFFVVLKNEEAVKIWEYFCNSVFYFPCNHCKEVGYYGFELELGEWVDLWDIAEDLQAKIQEEQEKLDKMAKLLGWTK